MSETTATQGSRPQPFLAIGFEDDTLLLVSTAPDRPHGVHLTKLHLHGLCDELTRSSSYQRQTGLVTKMKPTSQPVVTWSDMGRTAAYMVCRLGFTDGEEHYLLEVGPLLGTIRPEARSDVFQLSTLTGVRVQLERLHIEYGPDGLLTGEGA